MVNYTLWIDYSQWHSCQSYWTNSPFLRGVYRGPRNSFGGRKMLWLIHTGSWINSKFEISWVVGLAFAFPGQNDNICIVCFACVFLNYFEAQNKVLIPNWTKNEFCKECLPKMKTPKPSFEQDFFTTLLQTKEIQYKGLTLYKVIWNMYNI